MASPDRHPNPDHADDGRGRFLRGSPPARSRAKRPFIILALGVGALIAIASLLGENGLPTYLRLRQRQSDLESEVRVLREREAEMETRIEALENDPDALEKLAREKYRMKLPGEEVIEVVGEDLLEDPNEDPDGE